VIAEFLETFDGLILYGLVMVQLPVRELREYADSGFVGTLSWSFSTQSQVSCNLGACIELGCCVQHSPRFQAGCDQCLPVGRLFRKKPHRFELRGRARCISGERRGYAE